MRKRKEMVKNNLFPISDSSDLDEDCSEKRVFNIQISVISGSLQIVSTSEETTTNFDKVEEKSKPKQRSLRSKTRNTPAMTKNDLNISTSSNDEAFMANDNNFVDCPYGLRRSTRKKKTSSVKKTKNILNISTSSDDEAFMANNDNFVDSPYGLRRSTRKRKPSSVKSGNRCKVIKEGTPQKAMDETLSVDESFIRDMEDEFVTKNETQKQDAEPQARESKQVRSEHSAAFANAETDVCTDFSDCNTSICDESVLKKPGPMVTKLESNTTWKGFGKNSTIIGKDTVFKIPLLPAIKRIIGKRKSVTDEDLSKQLLTPIPSKKPCLRL